MISFRALRSNLRRLGGDDTVMGLAIGSGSVASRKRNPRRNLPSRVT